MRANCKCIKLKHQNNEYRIQKLIIIRKSLILIKKHQSKTFKQFKNYFKQRNLHQMNGSQKVIKLFSNSAIIILIALWISCIIQQASAYSLCTTQQSSCLICPIECTKCDSTTKCTSCSYQYYLQLSNNTCMSCSQYCVTCTSSTVCTQCLLPYVLTNGACLQCVISHASSCSSTISALACQNQYYINSNYCSSCLLNCQTCSSATTCTQCINNFYLNNTVLTCNPCPANCLTCNQFTPTVCTSCANGYLLNTADATCNKIDCSGIDNCIYCQDTNVCAQCNLFYYWDTLNAACVKGASVLCEYGANGPLPSQCINSCSAYQYQSQTSVTPFLCIPYRTIKLSSSSSTTKITQIYYYSYSDLADLQALSTLSSNQLVLQSSNQYSFSLNKLNLGVINSFYKIQIRMKYISALSSAILTLSSQSQSITTQTQSQTTTVSQSSSPISLSYTTRTVHSNNLLLSLSTSISLIQIYLKLYRCPSTCLQCLNNQLCQLCAQPNYMLGYECVSNCTVYYHFALNRTCVLNCPDGYYYITNGPNSKYCQICQSPCSTCVDSSKCLSCVGTYYFYNYTCTKTCVDGYYANIVTNVCDSCISPCQRCTSKSDCLSCRQGYWNGTKCTIVCKDGTFGNNLTNSCDNCDSNCATCTNTSISCTSCSSAMHLHNSKCILLCPARYYSSGAAPLTCLQCKPPCESCTSQTNCLSCSYNYFYAGDCIGNCPDGYYENLINNVCTACAATCLTCDDSNFCTSCPTTKCLSQGYCLASCPSAQWYKVSDAITGQCTCQQCKYPCKTCTSSTSCLSCLQGYYYQTSCLTQCPTTYYKNQLLRQCTLCNALVPYCSQCTSSNCTLCSATYLLHLGNCLTACPLYYYQLNQKCNKCIAPCSECLSFSQCSSCIPGYILHQGACIVSCPNGKYSYSTVVAATGATVQQCGACTSPCLYCSSTATNCTFCISNNYLFSNQCYLDCSTLTPTSSYYNEPVTSTCSKCMFPCKTCLSQYECLSCTIGYLNSAEKKCEQCVVGTYPNSALGVCQQCPVSCLICYSSTFCTVCADGYYLYQSQCIADLSICQSNGYYGIGRVCSLCQQPCKTCSKSSNNCTTCLSGYIKFSSNQCLSDCPNGYFRNSLTNNCDTCSAECTSCLSVSNYCFTCSVGFKLYSAQMKCLATCPKYTYAEGSFCTACKYPCFECSSQLACTTCISGALVGSQCLSSCSNGHFSNSSGICEQCASTCKQCVNSSTTCTQCPADKYLYNSTCLSVCPSRTFAQKQSSKCISCMGTCYQCNDHINCTSCANGLYFYISTLTNYGQCVTICSNGYFPSNASSVCIPCRSDCLTCTNASSCILCNNGRVMYKGNCFSECVEKMYSYEGVCQQCQLPCYNCSDPTTCTSCVNNSYLLVGNAQCIESTVCPVGYFQLENTFKCNSQCPAGYYHIVLNRTCNKNGCDEDSFKGLDYYCQSQCPQNYIANQSLQCQSCTGDRCYDGLYFSLKYIIQNDDLVLKLSFTQTPYYLVSKPTLTITPSIQYSLSSYVQSTPTSSTSSESNEIASIPQNQPVSTAIQTPGLKQLTFTLLPSQSLTQTYYKVRFAHPLQTFSNPLQQSSSTFYLQGYNMYDNSTLMSLSVFGVLALFAALIGLVKNPYITDYAQVLYVLALVNIHYPLNLRSFLQSTGLSFFHNAVSVQQSNMQGNGKFSYLTNLGLLSNTAQNLLIIFVGLILVLSGYLLLKFLEWYLEYGKVSGKVSPNEEKFIQGHIDQGNQPSVHKNQISNSVVQQDKPAQQKQKEQPTIPRSLRLKTFLTQAYTSQNIKILCLNRLVYFNYLPICLFTFCQLSNFSTQNGTNAISSVLSVFTLIFVVVGFPFWIIKQKPKYTFLYVRKVVVSASLILSVNYPTYCIGVLSVCNITALLLILAYKLEKWKVEMQINALGQGLQLLLMIGFAVFIMIGEGNKTQAKAYFAYILVFLAVLILLIYIGFSIFLFILYLLKKLCDKDYIAKWILDDKLDDTDGTDSQTLNSSMKDHQQKKPQPQKLTEKRQSEDINWNHIQNLLRNKQDPNDEQYLQNQIRDIIQSHPIQVSPSKFEAQQQPGTGQLFWKYDTNSQQDQNNLQKQQNKDKSPPKMLIRCINQFSDFDHHQEKFKNNDTPDKKKNKEDQRRNK